MIRPTALTVGVLGFCAAIADIALCLMTSRAQSVNEGQPQAGSDASPIHGITIPAEFPDGAIIAALHWSEVSSDENDKVSQRLSQRRAQIFRCWFRQECSVYGQGLKKVRREWRLGICRL
jgi:hypothetical protein